MPDGSRQFAVYVAGTQTAAPHTEEPFDMGSNLELYAGERSASYDAALAALRDAGAGSGDVVHAFGHSQGAMVAAHVALEGGFDTRTLVSFGSPIEADVGDRTLSISLRHSDDPVAALAGGGSAGAVGAPGSFIVSRTADPASGLHDFQLPAHGIDEYARTAMLLDDSGDRTHGGGAGAVRSARRRDIRRDHGIRCSARGGEAAAATRPGADRCGQSLFRGRRMMPKIQLMSEMMIAATTPHQKSSTRSPQLQKLVIQAVSHSRNALMMRPIKPSVRM